MSTNLLSATKYCIMEPVFAIEKFKICLANDRPMQFVVINISIMCLYQNE
jgi:hypothetical protein